jgi:iron-sulfur cluster repair protein YtfE (RIC family)
MGWHEGPLQSWYDIHEAIRNELIRIKRLVDEASVDDWERLDSISDEVHFLADVLTVHSLAEDGVAFPVMRSHGIEVPPSYSADHHRELSTLYAMRAALLELRFHDAGQDVTPTLKRLGVLIDAVSNDLDKHIEAEDGVLIPSCEAGMSLEDQASMITRMVADTPAWLAPRLTAWMVSNISMDHRVHLLTGWQEALPPAVFADKVAMIREGVDAGFWEELVSEMPALAD